MVIHLREIKRRGDGDQGRENTSEEKLKVVYFGSFGFLRVYLPLRQLKYPIVCSLPFSSE